MPEITIRKAMHADLQQIAELYALFWGEAPVIARMSEAYGKIMGDDRYCLLVAEKAGGIVGTIYGVLCQELYGECRPFMVMENLVVKASERRLGIGSRLFASLEAHARAMKCTQIQFITESTRADAISFYTGIGFDAGKHVGFKKKL